MGKSPRRAAAGQAAAPEQSQMFWVDSEGEESLHHSPEESDDDSDFIELDDSDDIDEGPDSTEAQIVDLIDLCNSDDEVVEILSDDLEDDDEPPPLGIDELLHLQEQEDGTYMQASAQVRNNCSCRQDLFASSFQYAYSCVT